VNVQIDWAALGEVFLVSFTAAIGVIVLFAFGVSGLAVPATNPTLALSETTTAATTPPTALRPLAALCFLTCALVVAYSLYLIIAK
jgi:hypothetical protein